MKVPLVTFTVEFRSNVTVETLLSPTREKKIFLEPSAAPSNVTLPFKLMLIALPLPGVQSDVIACVGNVRAAPLVLLIVAPSLMSSDPWVPAAAVPLAASVPSAKRELIFSVPELRYVPPVKVLVPVSVRAPVPAFVKEVALAPLLPITAEMVRPPLLY